MALLRCSEDLFHFREGIGEEEQACRNMAKGQCHRPVRIQREVMYPPAPIAIEHLPNIITGFQLPDAGGVEEISPGSSESASDHPGLSSKTAQLQPSRRQPHLFCGWGGDAAARPGRL